LIEGGPMELDLVALGEPQPGLARGHRLGRLGGSRRFGQSLRVKQGQCHDVRPARRERPKVK
jgi:hypothetical protein